MKIYAGRQLKVTAVCRGIARYDVRAGAENIVNNKGMKGGEGIYSGLGNDIDSGCFCGADGEFIFDFGQIVQLGYLFIWNLNNPIYLQGGLRKITVHYSSYGAAYKKFGSFELKRADGSACCRATNLKNGKPLDFGGLSARYIKIAPDGGHGSGNFGPSADGYGIFGLGQVRFFEYRKEPEPGGFIKARCFINGAEAGTLNSSLGLSDAFTPGALHTSDKDTMFLSGADPFERVILVDLQGTFPVKELHLWNYNESGNTGAGIKKAFISYSIDGGDWQGLEDVDGSRVFTFACAGGEDGLPATNLEGGRPVLFNNARARYIKIELQGKTANDATWGFYGRFEYRFGLSKIRIYAGEGFYTEPALDYDSYFLNYDGWGGADGIFLNRADGAKSKITGAAAQKSESIFVFSDTLLSKANPVTRRRDNFGMINHSFGYLTGMEPQDFKLEFDWGKDADGNPRNYFKPPWDGYYYWLQDNVVVNGKLYLFTLDVQGDPDGPEGFKFRIVGVDMIRVGLKKGRPDFQDVQYFKTPLFGHKCVCFGAGILNYSQASGYAGADGYIYLYGTIKKEMSLVKNLCVARFLPVNIEKFEAYTFFNGREFVPGIENSVPVFYDGGSEMSVTPWNGRFVYVHMRGGIGDTIGGAFADKPWGPFKDEIPLYHVTLGDVRGKNIYRYNAKIHASIGAPDELIASCNINACDFQTLINDADVYRPRFFRIKELRLNKKQ